VLDSDWYGMAGEGYTGVEGLGCGERAVREDGADLGSPLKTEPLGLGFG